MVRPADAPDPLHGERVPAADYRNGSSRNSRQFISPSQPAGQARSDQATGEDDGVNRLSQVIRPAGDRWRDLSAEPPSGPASRSSAKSGGDAGPEIVLAQPNSIEDLPLTRGYRLHKPPMSFVLSYGYLVHLTEYILL